MHSGWNSVRDYLRYEGTNPWSTDPTFARIAGDRDDIDAASRSLRGSKITGEYNAFSFTGRARGAL